MQDSLTSSFRCGETFDTAPLCQRLQHRGFNGDGRPPTKHYPCVPTNRYSYALSVSFFVSLELRNNNLIKQDRYGDTFFRGVPY